MRKYVALVMAAVAGLVVARRAQVPVLMLDDVFAELDEGRRERLAGLIADAEQVVITAAVPDDVPATLAGQTLRVADGRVGPEGGSDD